MVAKRLCWSALVLGVAGMLAACGGSGGGGGPPAPVAPAITTAPAAATVADGAAANFTVVASGDAPLAYRWRRNGIDLADGGGVTGSGTAALSLVSPYAFDGSQISVRVSNAAGNVTSANALLTVTALAPTIVTPPANATVAVGASATFSVVISGGTTPITYQWLRGGTAIAGATAASYTLPATVLGDSGASFSVRITNPAGNLTSAAATLTVTAGSSRSWQPAVKISGGLNTDEPGYPAVAIDAAGNAIAVWQQYVATGGSPALRNGVWSARYSAGVTWSSPLTIDRNVGNAIRPRIAMNPDGVAVAAFSQSTENFGGLVRMVSNRYSGSWSTPLDIDDPVAAANAERPAVAIAPSGVATVAFAQPDGTNGRVWLTRSSTIGTWPTPLIFDGAGPSDLPELATAPNGDTVLTWVQQTGAFTRALWARRFSAGAWSAPVLLTTDTGVVNSATIRVAAASNGDMMAVWSQTQGNGRVAVRATRLNALTGAWSAPVTLNDGARDAYDPRVAFDGNGNAMALWNESVGGLFSARFNGGSASWAASFQLQPGSLVAGGIPQLAIDAAGNAIAVWLQPSPTVGTRYELWTAQAGSTGGWGTPLKLMTDPAAYAQIGTDQEPRLAINADGDAVVVWYQRTDAPANGIWARVYR